MKKALSLANLGKPKLQFNPSEYADRRQRLGNHFRQSSTKPLIIIRGNPTTFLAPDVPHIFRQCSHFLYLTGINDPNACLIVNNRRSVLFVHVKSDKEVLWEGEDKSLSECKNQAAVDEVLPLSELAPFLASELKNSDLVADDRRAFPTPNVRQMLNDFGGQRAELFSAIDMLRLRKSSTEVAYMRVACDIGSDSMNALIQKAPLISDENTIVGFLEFEMRRRGASAAAYPPVVAAGDRANTIHYINSNKEIKPGDCVLVDAGADFNGYVSDITRCFPVSGSFSSPQKELYEALLEIQKECISHLRNNRPSLSDLYLHMFGAMAATLNSIAFFNRQLKESELIYACQELCPHHVGHYLGMDVHDTPTVARTLVPTENSIITVEPGVYVKRSNNFVRNEFKGIGFRIEDNILIKSSDIEILSKSCIKDLNEIETAMNECRS